MTVQDKVQWATEQWNLRNTVVIYERENKAVYSSESKLWGNIVLKVNENTGELASEYNMLNEMSGKSCCRVYAYDATKGFLMEERIIPGTVLRNEKNAAVRIDCFLTIFKDIHKKINNVQHYPTYLDWLRKAEQFCMNHDLEESVLHHMHKACGIGEELFVKYDDRVLLHGDLHHDNMILNDKGIYCIIDPKGVLGPEIFDIPRFVLNEMDYVSEPECKNHIVQIVDMISKKMNYSFSDIMKLFFMEVILANVWCIEDGEEANYHNIAMAAELLKELAP